MGGSLMIETLEIRNFKSIKELSLPCKQFNLFIGEPGSGKSNLLEALGLLSFIDARQYDPEVALDGFVRHERTSNLFYDEDVGETMSVLCDGVRVFISCASGHYGGGLTCFGAREGGLRGDYCTITEASLTHIGRQHLPAVKFYRSSQTADFGDAHGNFLVPPTGENLPSLLVQNRELRHAVNLPFVQRGLRLGLRPQENKIELVKSIDDIIISYPYSLASDTLQRLTFYTAAILTNKDSALVFEEPEAHSFPNHTKYLAEQIALEENGNQYFIATHNPYFLMPLLSKAGQDDIAINIVYYEDHQTKVKTLPPEDLPELFELNIFANLDQYIEA